MWKDPSWRIFICHAIYDPLMGLSLYASERKRIDENNDNLKKSFVTWSMIISLIILAYLQSSIDRWTKRSWEIFIRHAILDYLMCLLLLSLASRIKWIGEQVISKENSLVTSSTIALWSPACCVWNELNGWTEQCWERFLRPMIFNHHMHLPLVSLELDK